MLHRFSFRHVPIVSRSICINQCMDNKWNGIHIKLVDLFLENLLLVILIETQGYPHFNLLPKVGAFLSFFLFVVFYCVNWMFITDDGASSHHHCHRNDHMSKVVKQAIMQHSTDVFERLTTFAIDQSPSNAHTHTSTP